MFSLKNNIAKTFLLNKTSLILGRENRKKNINRITTRHKAKM